MLFYDRKKITNKDLCRKFGVDFEMIKKNPAFEVAAHRKKVDMINGGRIKTPVGSSVRSHFMVTDPHSGLKVELRYATAHRPEVVGNSLMDKFEPRYVEFLGVKAEFRNDLDKAVYLYFHNSTEDSMFQAKTERSRSNIAYIDTKKRSTGKIANLNMLAEAMEHAKNLPVEKLIILAKGLGLKGIEKKDELDVRAEVLEYASKFPKEYNEKSYSNLTYYEGKVYHLVDKGVIKLSNMGAIRRWSWAAGPREGETIVDIHNINQEAKTALKNHIYSDMNNYMGILDTITDTLTAKQKAEQFLSSQIQKDIEPQEEQQVIGDELPDHLKQVNAVTPIASGLPTNFKEAVAYLEQKDGKRPSNIDASKFLKDVQAGAVTV